MKNGDKINTAIAEHCGWKRAIKNYSAVWWHDDRMGSFLAPPHYSTSLDVMATAEATLKGKAHPSATTDEEKEYRDALAQIMGVGWYQSGKLIFATAPQRAEAFIKVKKLKV